MNEKINNDDIFNKSILLIGPMATGKTTLGRILHEKTGMPLISLDDRQQLKEQYSKYKDFTYFKDFEFYLTEQILTNLSAPTIVEFGAGHSVYENEEQAKAMSKIIKNFKNVVMVLPSPYRKKTEKILKRRLLDRCSNSKIKFTQIDIEHQLSDNKHFIDEAYKSDLPTISVYTADKSPKQTTDEIIERTIIDKESGKILSNNEQSIEQLAKTNFLQNIINRGTSFVRTGKLNLIIDRIKSKFLNRNLQNNKNDHNIDI